MLGGFETFRAPEREGYVVAFDWPDTDVRTPQKLPHDLRQKTRPDGFRSLDSAVRTYADSLWPPWRCPKPASGEWDEDLVRDIFWLLSIPLADDCEDFVAWHNLKTGILYIKISVLWEWSHKFRQSFVYPRDMVGSISHEVWADIWKEKVSSKVKWKQLARILAKRHVCDLGPCQLCPLRIRTICFFACTRAKQIWKELGLKDESEKDLCTNQDGAVVLE